MPKMNKKRERFDVIQIYTVRIGPTYNGVPGYGSYNYDTEQRRRILSRHKSRQEANAARDARLVLESMGEASKSIAVYVQRQTYSLARRNV